MRIPRDTNTAGDQVTCMPDVENRAIQLGLLPDSGEAGLVNPTFDQGCKDEKKTWSNDHIPVWVEKLDLDNSLQTSTPSKDLSSPSGDESRSTRDDMHKYNEDFNQECANIFVGHESTTVDIDDKNARINACFGHSKRQQNGHVLVGNSVSSCLEGQRSPPKTVECPEHLQVSPLSSWNSTSSQHDDSGVCSEATSAVEPYANVNLSHSEGTSGTHHSSNNLSEQCYNLYPECRDKRVDKDETVTEHSHHIPIEHEIRNKDSVNNRHQNEQRDQQESLSAAEPVLIEIKQFNNLAQNGEPVLNENRINPCASIDVEGTTSTDRTYYKKPEGTKENDTSEKHPPSKKNQKRPWPFRTPSVVTPNKTSSESIFTKYTSRRWQLAYLCFLARFIQTALRQCMGVAVIAMTFETTHVIGTNSTNATANVTHSNLTTAEFAWSSAFEGVILSSFNMGSIITPIIVGYLAIRYGGRRLMTICLVGGGMFTVLLPIAARAHPALIIVIRIIIGVALSGTDSLVQAMWAKWAPYYEKASLSSCAFTGLSVAGVLTFLVCGYLASIGGEGEGWPYIFYLFGSLCLLLAPLWFYVVYDSPERHPRITKKELAIITFNKTSQKYDSGKQALNPPWKRIFTSPAVWVIMMGHITHKWILSFMLSYLPRFFSDLFEFDIETDGLFSSLPFVGRIISGIIAGHFSDWMLVKGFSTGTTRKTFQGAGCWGCALFSLLIAFIPNLSIGWSTTLLVLALSFQNLTSVAFRINLLDIAPRYAGLLNGVVSTIATIVSLPAPVLTSLLLSGGSRQGWQIVFCLVAGLNIVGGLIFVLFAKGEVQEWATVSFEKQQTQRKAMADKTEGEIHGLEIFSSETSKDTPPKPFPFRHAKALREVKSCPAARRSRKQVLGRRATLDVGSLIKRVQNEAFANLALADL